MTSQITSYRSYVDSIVSKISIILISCTFLTILAVFYIDLVILDRLLISEGLPNFETVYVFRTALIALSSLLFVISVVKFRTSTKERIFRENASEVWGSWGIVTWSINDHVERDTISVSVSVIKKIILWVVLLLSLFLLFIFYAHPYLFSKLAREGQSIETLSALMYFLECSVFIYISLLLRPHLVHTRKFFAIISLSIALVFFLISMEEVSWFQRFLSIKTPELFKGNLQNEINFHNFHTDLIENIYYFGTFVFLILIPFINDRTNLFGKNSTISFFVPSRLIMFVSAITVSYNIDMWNILFTQLSFFITLFILSSYMWSHKRLDEEKFYILATITICILSQVLFLIFGSSLAQIWKITEYKEFFIPISFMLYSFEMLHKTKRVRGRHVRSEAGIELYPKQ